jgi:TetR/AcrR family transcriptional repressor of nem operon
VPTATPASRRPGRPAGQTRTSLLDAAVKLIRRQGLCATSIDQICAAAGVTKGAFFHHFASKNALAVAAADHWSTTTETLFAAAEYHDAERAADRVLGYLTLRDDLVAGPPEAFTCLVGTMAQEVFADHPDVRDACGESILGHAATLERDIASALGGSSASTERDAASLARFTQVVLQGAFVVAKATDDEAVVHDAITHLRRYFTALFDTDHTPARATTGTPPKRTSPERKATT